MFITSTRPHTCISSRYQGYRLVLRRLHVTSYTYGYEMRWRHASAVTASRSHRMNVAQGIYMSMCPHWQVLCDTVQHWTMVLDMRIQQCLGNECLATKFALVWSLPCVVAHVNWQWWTLCKTLAAFFAGVRFHTCVSALMNIQVLRRTKCFATNITHKRFLTCVCTLVCLQWHTTCQCLTTDITDVVGLSSVGSHMFQEFVSK